MPACHKYYVMMICVQQRNNTTVPYNVFNHSKTKRRLLYLKTQYVEWKRNLMAHGDAREEKWMGKEANGVGSQQSGTVSEHVLSSITTADAHISAASSRLNWHPRRYKWTRPLRWKTKSGFCACAITIRFHSTTQ